MTARDDSMGKNGLLVWRELLFPCAALYLLFSAFDGFYDYSQKYNLYREGYYTSLFVLISLSFIAAYLFYCFFQLGRTARLIIIINDKVEVTDFFGRVSLFTITDIKSLDKINMNIFLKRYFLYADYDKYYKEMTNSKICFKDGSWYYITPKMSGLDEIRGSLGLM